MPKATKICRVCGKQYEACHTEKVDGTFRWQEVACSPECGEEYLRRVMEARNPSVKSKRGLRAKIAPVKNESSPEVSEVVAHVIESIPDADIVAEEEK